MGCRRTSRAQRKLFTSLIRVPKRLSETFSETEPEPEIRIIGGRWQYSSTSHDCVNNKSCTFVLARGIGGRVARGPSIQLTLDIGLWTSVNPVATDRRRNRGQENAFDHSAKLTAFWCTCRLLLPPAPDFYGRRPARVRRSWKRLSERSFANTGSTFRFINQTSRSS
jgi:hypothetical protein